PTPLVATSEMQAAVLQAFMWLMIRFRRSAGVDSMKLTVNWRGRGPQYFDVSTAMARGGAMLTPSGSDAIGPNAGALTGLILVAVSAAFVRSRVGRNLRAQ